ncbi:hypothetical protein L2E82_03358 [Cichorium intybus]|uniref:Uncharacterized protein n=1 Tax=Cichorium intybus TaxID=13427 RepID=A0ACB9H5C3_CICIN|nr:hypothetical protein L2E82_03358 [Cichorium intybus]
MEDDDEFGDLYTDVLQPLQMSSAPPQPPIQSTPQPPSRSIDLNDRIPSDDEEILYGAKNSGKLTCDQPGPNLNLNKRDGAAEKNEKYWGEEAAPPPDSGGRVFGGSSGLVKVEEKGFEQDPNFMDDVKGEFSQIKEERLDENFGIEDAEEEDEFLIPGLSSSGARVLERGGKEGEGGDDWDDSDSEDDLQIVLNDNTGGGIMGMDGGVGQDEEDDEDGDNLVIVTGNADPNLHHHHPPMDDLQDWGEDPGQAAEGVGERKDLLGGDPGRPEVGGATAAQKIGYGSHGYHPFHSQFKYVRPGAAPMPGAGPVPTGGVQGQIRPPASMLPFAGRGRGDWRPAGIKNVGPMQKNFQPGYGAQSWGNNGAGRGLDFTLPSHKTIFEVDIDGFEEKPWRLQGIDVSDFFNFGMNEDSWKEYCKQLDQHRLEATMQSKIRVYESGRTEQEYDPDLPPELAAAAGHDISENRHMGKIDMQNDLTKGSARGRMQLPTGKAIQVETGFGERLPSIDTRPPRVRDSDAIIEIVLQRSPEREEPEDDVPSHRESEEEEDIVSENDHFDRPQIEASGRKPPSMTPTRETEPEDHLDPSSPVRARSSSFDQNDATKHEIVVVDRKSTERGVDTNTNDNTKTRRTMKKQKHSSVERDDSKAGKSSENSKQNSMEQEVIQSGSSTVRRQERQERESHYSHRKWDPNTHRPHVKPETFDRKKPRESEGVVCQQDDDIRKQHKIRENERIEKIEHRSRKQQSENNGLKTRHNVSDKREEHRESTSRRKRERDDNLDQNKWKEEGRLQREKRERDEWKERAVGIGHSRVKEEYRSSEKDYRRERVENENVSRHRGREDGYGHGNKVSNEERVSRHERERGYSGKDMQKESVRKGKESDAGIHNSVAGSRRNRDDHSSQRSERASSKSVLEQRGDQNPAPRRSSKKHKENPSSEDEQQESRKGRSKLERWTSHKERDFGVALKETDNGGHTKKLPDEPAKPPQETINNSKPQDKESNAKNDDPKPTPTDDKHLDTVEKLKKRSERFKLPMPSEKEALAIKKMENEPLSSVQPEARPESEVKPERPARKRRWTSG